MMTLRLALAQLDLHATGQTLLSAEAPNICTFQQWSTFQDLFTYSVSNLYQCFCAKTLSRSLYLLPKFTHVVQGIRQEADLNDQPIGFSDTTFPTTDWITKGSMYMVFDTHLKTSQHLGNSRRLSKLIQWYSCHFFKTTSYIFFQTLLTWGWSKRMTARSVHLKVGSKPLSRN